MTRVNLLLNTAITGTDESGKWDESAHRQSVLPLRGKVMQRVDGVTGMFIARYGIEVDYLPHIVQEQAIIDAVQKAVDELAAASDNGLFPLRGDKRPTVEVERPKPTYRKTVIARFNTDLVAYTKDETKWTNTQNAVAEMLTHLDGVRGYAVSLRELGIVFDTRYTTEDLVKAHLESIVEGFVSQSSDNPYFPFLFLRGAPDFDVTFRVVEGDVL